MIRWFDAHIHLDMYTEEEASLILEELPASAVLGLIAVSRHMDSCQATKRLRDRLPEQVFAAYGFHPEQTLPQQAEMNKLIDWIREHSEEMVAIGEVGLPYYNRHEALEKGQPFDLQPHIALLDDFIALSKELDKPIILHAVYEDADIACDLLEKHQENRAHFHWFKGSERTLRRMAEAGYFISITPDVVYEPEIQALVRTYPLELMMVETDGPWPFEGPFAEQLTHPSMIQEVIHHIAAIKSQSIEEVAEILVRNTRQFYRIAIE
jgi:TatD DNase family protein